jgi:ribonuclease HI
MRPAFAIAWWRPMALYADGGVIRKNPSSIGGTWAFCLVGPDGEQVLEYSGLVIAKGKPRHPDIPTAVMPDAGDITNNVTEFVALSVGLAFLSECFPGWSGEVCSDSRITLIRMFEMAKTRGLPPDLVALAAECRSKLGTLTPVLCKGHCTREWLAAGQHPDGRRASKHNAWCDAECTRQGEAYFDFVSPALPAPAIAAPGINQLSLVNA